MEKRTFEQALAELEKITLKIADDETGIEELLPLFKEGEKLRLECERLLNSVEVELETYSK